MSGAVIPGVDLVQLDLHCDCHAARLAREAFSSLEGIDAVREEARLVVTELVSNAVRHSGCSASDSIEVRARRRDRVLELSVTDPGLSGRMPRIRPHGADESGGRGLPIVEELAVRWGTVRTENDRRLVWAELTLGLGSFGDPAAPDLGPGLGAA